MARNVENMTYTAYTDGVSYKTDNGLGSSAYIVLQNGKLVCENSKTFSQTNCPRMKMLSIISAVNNVPKGSVITVYSDFELAIKVLSKVWNAQKNLDLISLYDKVSEGKDVELVWKGVKERDPLSKRVKDMAYSVYNQNRPSLEQGTFTFVPKPQGREVTLQPMVVYPDDDAFYSEDNPFNYNGD